MMRRIVRSLRCVALIASVSLFLGCEDDSGGDDSGTDFGDNDRNVIVALGDSITRGYGLSGGESYPAQLAGMEGRPVINSGLDGEHSWGGRGRVNGVLSRHKPGYLLVLYGSNDAIAGESPQSTVENLRGIVQAAKANKTIPILATVPTAYDSHAFMAPRVAALNPLIKSMASEEGVRVADVNGAVKDRSLFLGDGLHPNAAGAGRLASAFGGKL
ncbi:MAG: GDSL-type esterase/lipase family protein [Verrucomicrobia bacterium]|nr:GDSL-type esterase/lipase family protein [Verrucomicrobiota bacterium]